MNIGTVSTWTIARVESLKALVLEGFSSSQIAFKLGFTTRNAVIGKVFRLKLSRDGVMKKTAPRAPRQLPPKPRQSPKRFTTVFDNVQRLNLRHSTIMPLNVSLVDIEPHQCRWPYGALPEGILFCGHDKRDGSSYCESHFTLSKRLMT